MRGKTAKAVRGSAFTLVELIVVITILAILGTISFIALQGYSRDARDTKRITEIGQLLRKIEIEHVKGVPYKNLIDAGDLTPKTKAEVGTIGIGCYIGTGTILGNSGITICQGPANFPAINENPNSFKNGTEGYIFAYTEPVLIQGESREFIQGTTALENGRNKVVGNYYTSTGSDTPGLVVKNGTELVDGGKSVPDSCPGQDTSGSNYDGRCEPLPPPPVDCTAYTLNSCPEHGTCTQCTGNGANDLYKLDRCDENYHIDGNICEENTPETPASCPAGQYVDANACEDVGNEYYSPADDTQRYACPANSTTNGITTANSVSQCLGNAGYYNCESGTCSVANTGYYSPANSNARTACPESGTTSTTTASSNTECKKLNVVCTGKPANHSAYNTATTITQTYNGSQYLPTATATQNDTSSTTECRYTCTDGYTGNNCDTLTITSWTNSVLSLKREATPSISSFKWAINDGYVEPAWNGISYDFPTGRTADDYPAFKHCTDIGLGWRLPTRNELATLVDYKTTNTNGAYTSHPALLSYSYYSSTPANSFEVWRIYFDPGDTNKGNRAAARYVICVHE